MCYRCREPATITITVKEGTRYKLCIDCAVVIIDRIKNKSWVGIYKWITDEAYLQESVNE